jgi:hypothetical protein
MAVVVLPTPDGPTKSVLVPGTRPPPSIESSSRLPEETGSRVKSA